MNMRPGTCCSYAVGTSASVGHHDGELLLLIVVGNQLLVDCSLPCLNLIRSSRSSFMSSGAPFATEMQEFKYVVKVVSKPGCRF